MVFQYQVRAGGVWQKYLRPTIAIQIPHGHGSEVAVGYIPE
jgi:hypothetical protein